MNTKSGVASVHASLDAEPRTAMTNPASPPAHFELAGVRRTAVRRYRSGRAVQEDETDWVVQESPVALEYNGISHATLLATPCDLEELALGFSLTEGIIRGAADLYDVDITETAQGHIARLTIANACFAQLKHRRRTLAGRTGCGLCGLETLDDVTRDLPPVAGARDPIDPAAIVRAMQLLLRGQALHRRTGGTHAAAWADLSGNILHVREDVGRHNALDKLIGRLKHRRSGLDTSAGFVPISSRASFEMVQKAAAAGISAVVAISAPTHYAVETAERLGVMLIGFARGEDFTVYSHAERLK